jgi:hypothetical protein
MPSADTARRRRSHRIQAWLGGCFVGCAMVYLPQSGGAQPLEAAAPPPGSSMACPPPSVPSSSDPLVRSLATEWARLKQDWCKVLRWDDTWPRVQDLLVDVFTGPGVHPTAGIVVPDGGVAGGFALNVDWNANVLADQRFVTSAEGRISQEGFWEVGAKLQTLFAGYSERGKSPQLTLVGKHLDLPHLPYYGLGNNTSRHDKTFYGLRDTAVAASFDVPVPLGFALSAEVAGLGFAPDVTSSFTGVNNESSAPGLHARPTYVRPRASATWTYPERGSLYGLSSSAVASYGLYETLTGGNYSFGRVEALWNVGLGLDPRWGTFRFASRVVVSDPRAHNDVPFYLQPTLGGADINDENVLRGYSNYRFRAPNLVAYEISYERRIIDPLGIRIFGQLGRVGLRTSDLGFDGLKSSMGATITFRLGGAAVAELSFGWSEPEGFHVFGTGNSNNLGGVTAGLRGVF